MMRTQAMPLDKRAVIAQGLYGMAVQDKTQPVRFLTPGTRRQLAERLDQYRTLLPWMTSEQPMTDEQMQRLIRHAEDCRGALPPLPPSTRAALAAGCTAENQGPPDEAERLLLVEMDMLLNAAEQWLARPRSLRSGPWITGILAPHNLPRPFWRGGRRGLWDAPYPPMTMEDALRAARDVPGPFCPVFPFFPTQKRQPAP